LICGSAVNNPIHCGANSAPSVPTVPAMDPPIAAPVQPIRIARCIWPAPTFASIIVTVATPTVNTSAVIEYSTVRPPRSQPMPISRTM
jgi:hypothetical protein